MDSTHEAGTSSQPQVGTSVASKSNPSKYVNLVRKLINHQTLVKIEDGRYFCGSFYCIGKQGNILLKNAVEYHATNHDDPSSVESRPIGGLVLIPITCQKSCHVDCSIEEQLSILRL